MIVIGHRHLLELRSLAAAALVAVAATLGSSHQIAGAQEEEFSLDEMKEMIIRIDYRRDPQWGHQSCRELESIETKEQLAQFFERQSLSLLEEAEKLELKYFGDKDNRDDDLFRERRNYALDAGLNPGKIIFYIRDRAINYRQYGLILQDKETTSSFFNGYNKDLINFEDELINRGRFDNYEQFYDAIDQIRTRHYPDLTKRQVLSDLERKKNRADPVYHAELTKLLGLLQHWKAPKQGGSPSAPSGSKAASGQEGAIDDEGSIMDEFPEKRLAPDLRGSGAIPEVIRLTSPKEAKLTATDRLAGASTVGESGRGCQ